MPALLKAALEAGEVDRLFGASGRVRARIEIEHELAPGEIGKRNGSAAVAGQRERRRLGAGAEFAGHMPSFRRFPRGIVVLSEYACAWTGRWRRVVVNAAIRDAATDEGVTPEGHDRLEEYGTSAARSANGDAVVRSASVGSEPAWRFDAAQPSGDGAPDRPEARFRVRPSGCFFARYRHFSAASGSGLASSAVSWFSAASRCGGGSPAGRFSSTS